MRLSLFMLLGFGVIGVMLTAIGGTTAVQSVRELQEVRRAAKLGDIETTAMTATVAMSLERSVTQVALAFKDPIPDAFRQIIDEQRALADEGLRAAVELAENADYLSVKDDYIQQTRESMQQVADLRREIDGLLQVARADRDLDRAYKLPFALKTQVVTLKNATQLLRNRMNVSSEVAGAMQAIQLGAWEVREFGGRARTYFAIATLNEAPISAVDAAQLAIDRDRARNAWASLTNSALNVQGVPEEITADISAAESLYFQEYAAVLAQLESVSNATADGERADYHISFADFFDISNGALGAMETLSRDSGLSLKAYWQDREASAWWMASGSVAFAVISLGVMGVIYLQLRVRVIGLLGATSRLLSSLARGDLDIRVREKRKELVEIKDLHTTIINFRDKMLQVRQAEADAAEQQKQLQIQHAEQEKQEAARQAEIAAQEKARAEAQYAKERSAAKDIAKVVEACAAGDFSQRLTLEDKEGVFAEICDGLNRIGDAADLGLGSVRKALDRLAQGDLSHRMSEDFEGVFAEIAVAMNDTTESLSKTLSDISGSSTLLDEASHNIANASTDLRRRSDRNASSLAQTAQDIAQMASSVSTAAEAAKVAGSAVKSVEELAGSGNRIVAETIEAMNEIKSSSDEIGQVLKLIDNIAFQTNLLALNAGVEAARAGEQGRGFAVVATEVRELAMRSSNAAQDIANLINTSADQVNRGVDLVNESGESLSGIVSAVSDASSKLEDIVIATSQTSTGIGGISKATSDLDADTKNNAVGFAETETAVQSLRDISIDLTKSVAAFRLQPSVESELAENDVMQQAS